MQRHKQTRPHSFDDNLHAVKCLSIYLRKLIFLLTQGLSRVPRRSTEFFSPLEREAQATDQLPFAPANQLWALTTLHKHNSHSCLKLYDYKKSKQDDSGFVPEGYILYLVVQKYPGVSLTKDLFWQLSLRERDAIRQALKAALMYG
jgi:hypothetical protein